MSISMNNVVSSRKIAAVLFAAASAAVGTTADAAISTVTSITTQVTNGITTSVTGVNGVATANGSSTGFTGGSYTVQYGGAVNRVLTITGGGTTYNATGLATNVVRRVVSTQNNDQLWFMGTGNQSSSTLAIKGPAYGGFSQAFDANNLYIGADNLFSNQGNSVGNNSNVTRLDLFFGGFKASNSSAFAIFDRGPTNDHDAYKIAAITGLDGSGAPNSYGPLVTLAHGSYGTTDVVASTEELILRKNNSAGSDTFHPADYTNQPIGGAVIPTASLVASGTTIYGYSIFSNAVTSADNLVNWNGLERADSTSTGGGLDPVATVAVLYTTPSVPEPTTAALAAVAATGLLGRRRKN